MKTTYSIAAIAMFAVILGMGALAPAMASKPMANEDHKIEFCHYQEAKAEITDIDNPEIILEEAVLEAYLVIETDKKGKMNGHFKGKDQVAHHFPADEFGKPLLDENTGLPLQGDFIFPEVKDGEEPVDVEGVNDSIVDCLALDAALVSTDAVLVSTDKAEV